MSSPAFNKYCEGTERAARIRSAVADPRLRPISRDQAQAFAHAALAAYVAAWDTYINQLARDFYAVTAKPTDVAFHAMHEISRNESRNVGKRFNTPNWENSRDFLLRTTGFDPLPFWVWPARKMSSPIVQEKLNQILKVRHAFAHGTSIPSYDWNRTPKGQVRLNTSVLRDIEAFFNNLAKQTDRGMAGHIANLFPHSIPW